jgi:hypothetical protein
MSGFEVSGDAFKALVEVTCSDEGGAGTVAQASDTAGLAGSASAAIAVGAATVLSAVAVLFAGTAQLGGLCATSLETAG